jgi:hypothetical protein
LLVSIVVVLPGYPILRSLCSPFLVRRGARRKDVLRLLFRAVSNRLIDPPIEPNPICRHCGSSSHLGLRTVHHGRDCPARQLTLIGHLGIPVRLRLPRTGGPSVWRGRDCPSGVAAQCSVPDARDLCAGILRRRHCVVNHELRHLRWARSRGGRGIAGTTVLCHCKMSISGGIGQSSRRPGEGVMLQGFLENLPGCHRGALGARIAGCTGVW